MYSIKLNSVTITIFILYCNNQIELIKCKSEQKYVTYTVTPGFEKYVDDDELKSRIKDKQSRIEAELQDQFKHAKTINESLKLLHKNGAIVTDNDLSHGIKFQESTIGLMEAPIFLIEPPLLLPFDKFRDDEFTDNLMRKTGLNPPNKSIEQSDIEKLADPHNITDLNEANIAKALFKQELKGLMEEKKALLNRMEELEKELVVDNSKEAKRKFTACSKEIHELDSTIKEYINKIEKVNRVKRSIIKREGYNPELMDDELEIEAIERELEKQTGSNPKESKKTINKTKDKHNDEHEEHDDEEEEDTNEHEEEEKNEENEDENDIEENDDAEEE